VPETEQEWRSIQREFYTRWNFPNCFGAIDGKHVIIRCLPKTGCEYFNYKHSFSIILMAVVDANDCFLYIDVSTNGRVNNARVFSKSSFYDAMEHNILHLPPNGVFVADDTFPLKTNLLKPYSRSGPLRECQQIFNYRLSRARRIVENTFGILTSRFRIFEKPIPFLKS
uniref:Nuclease HARBI1 n=1 Tax=Diabrotica virgifera virgifera TaxID=50390 RepID=A0A6P7HBR2_DIAVI